MFEKTLAPRNKSIRHTMLHKWGMGGNKHIWVNFQNISALTLLETTIPGAIHLASSVVALSGGRLRHTSCPPLKLGGSAKCLLALALDRSWISCKMRKTSWSKFSIFWNLHGRSHNSEVLDRGGEKRSFPPKENFIGGVTRGYFHIIYSIQSPGLSNNPRNWLFRVATQNQLFGPFFYHASLV